MSAKEVVCFFATHQERRDGSTPVSGCEWSRRARYQFTRLGCHCPNHCITPDDLTCWIIDLQRAFTIPHVRTRGRCVPVLRNYARRLCSTSARARYVAVRLLRRTKRQSSDVAASKGADLTCTACSMHLLGLRPPRFAEFKSHKGAGVPIVRSGVVRLS